MAYYMYHIPAIALFNCLECVPPVCRFSGPSLTCSNSTGYNFWAFPFLAYIIKFSNSMIQGRATLLDV